MQEIPQMQKAEITFSEPTAVKLKMSLAPKCQPTQKRRPELLKQPMNARGNKNWFITTSFHVKPTGTGKASLRGNTKDKVN
jgi:hypothetical protein